MDYHVLPLMTLEDQFTTSITLYYKMYCDVYYKLLIYLKNIAEIITIKLKRANLKDSNHMVM